jgi:hypothetical protein
VRIGAEDSIVVAVSYSITIIRIVVVAIVIVIRKQVIKVGEFVTTITIGVFAGS